MILITGATGFLGAELMRQLLSTGQPLRALRRSTSVLPGFLAAHPNIEWYQADFLDYFGLKAAMEGVTEVYHCAAMVSFNKADRKTMLRVNVEGTANLVNICLENNNRKLLHVSSVAAVGKNKFGGAATEADIWQQNPGQSGYAISKYESEMEVFRGIAEGLNALIVNPSVIIGKHAGRSGSSLFFQTVKNGTKYYPGGGCGLVDVEDVARIMILLMKSDFLGERFILNAENYSYRDLFSGIARGYNLPPPNKRLQPWMLNAAYYASTIAKGFGIQVPAMSREIVRGAFKTSAYSNSKITSWLNYTFKPVETSILEICRTDI